jgi:hypothetical protein
MWTMIFEQSSSKTNDKQILLAFDAWINNCDKASLKNVLGRKGFTILFLSQSFFLLYSLFYSQEIVICYIEGQK